MRRDVGILLGTLALGAIARWGHTVPDALSEMETFRIRDVEVSGIRYLTEEAVVARLALAPETSVWTDPAALAERILGHPLVRDVKIARKVPNGLRVTVSEREPIALAPTPTLEPVDADGRRLPLDPAAHRLDLPVIASRSLPPAGSLLFPEDVRALAAEIHHLSTADASFLRMVSTVRRDRSGALVARWTEPPVDFLLPSRASPARLREGLGALSNAISRTPGEVPHEIDLRFADQVVVRRGGR